MLRLDWNMVITIINLIVLCLLLKKFLIGPVTAIMEQRAALIEQQLADAKSDKQTAEDLKASYEEKLKTSDAESIRLVEESKARARAEYDRIVAEAGRKAAKILEDAKTAAAQEQEKTLEEARTQIAGLVMAAAAKVLSEGGEADQSRQLYDQYLAKAGVTDESNRN
ncbi:MAG: F0F1 ATP synthase subunit B [Enterocloster asparagiformis]|nr:F0F1 ATP synthase subunit B [Enterocloster asparagiformis]